LKEQKKIGKVEKGLGGETPRTKVPSKRPLQNDPPHRLVPHEELRAGGALLAVGSFG